MPATRLPKLLRDNETSLLDAWTSEQKTTGNTKGRISDADIREQSKKFLELLQQASTEGDISKPNDQVFEPLRHFLSGVSSSRALLGFSPSETALFVFSFKQPLFAQIRQTYKDDPQAQVDEIWAATLLIDHFGLYTTEAYQKGREDVIYRQQLEMLELSTPVVKLSDGILALPIIGTLDSARTQTIMESLLERIVSTGSEIAIIDITGVPTVDTLTAQHLLKTITAARLMGAECIISGIRPQIAQTIVHLGVELGDVITKASLADAFRVALQRTGQYIAKTKLVSSAPTKTQAN